MSSVVVFGSCNVDLVVRAPRHPEPGETLIGTGFATHAGGKGANQAVAAARAGVSVSMVGRLGNDSGAEFLRSALSDAAVATTFVGTCRHDPSGTALITVADSGENTIIVVPGANALLRPVHVEDAVRDGVLADSPVVLIQREIPLDVVLTALAAARHAGCKTVLNAAPAGALPGDVLDLVDVLVVNETELAAVAGTTSADPVDWPMIGSVTTILLTLGERGVVFATASDTKPGSWDAGSLPGHHVDVADTTAAGDTFCGYVAAGLSAGSTIADACRTANAAAALACTVPGAQPSIPTVVAVHEFLDRSGG